MGNKKNGPGDGFRAWLTGQDNLGPMGKKWATIVGTGLSAIGTGMGLQSRGKKKQAFMKKYYPDKTYNKKTMKDEFKRFRKGTDEMKTGGAWTRNSRKHGSK